MPKLEDPCHTLLTRVRLRTRKRFMSTNPSLPAVAKLLPSDATIDTHGPQLHSGLRMALLFAERLAPKLQSLPVTISTATHGNSCGLMFVNSGSGRAVQVAANNNAGCATMFVGVELQFAFPTRVPADDCQFAHFTEDEMDVYVASAAAHLRGAAIMDLGLTLAADLRRSLLQREG